MINYVYAIPGEQGMFANDHSSCIGVAESVTFTTTETSLSLANGGTHVARLPTRESQMSF